MRKSINIIALALLFVLGACSTKDDTTNTTLDNAALFQADVKDMEITLDKNSPLAPAFFNATDGKTFTIKAVGNDNPVIVATFTAATDAKNATYTTADSKVYTIILGANKVVSYQLAGGVKVSGFLRAENSIPVIPDNGALFLEKVKNKEMTPTGGDQGSIYGFFDDTAGTTFTMVADGTNPRFSMTFTAATDANNATYTSTDGTVYTFILGDADVISYQAAGGTKIDGGLKVRS